MRNLLDGENVRLNAIRETDLERIEEWHNDVRFLRYYDMLPAVPQTGKDVKKFIDEMTESKDGYIFAIRQKNSDQIIGVTGFNDIIWTNGVATMFIGIGDENYKGRGIGHEAIQLLLDFGFNELNFYRIQLNVIAYNEKAIRAYEKSGFKREGAFREFIYRDGLRYDMYLYGLLKSEWVK